MAFSVLTGSIAGATAMLGLLQMIHAQSPAAAAMAGGSLLVLDDSSVAPPNVAVPRIDIRGPRDPWYFYLRPSAKLQRDPNGLYQFGEKAAVVELARVDLTNNVIYFAAIKDAPTLKVDADFEYQNYVLHYQQAANEIIRISDGRAETPDRVFFKVVCKIVSVKQ